MLQFEAVSWQSRLIDLNFQAKVGEVTVLLGANGSGKSSILSLAAGLAKALYGKITWQQQAVSTFPHSVFAKQRAMLEQQIPSKMGLSVQAVLRLAAFPHGLSEDAIQPILEQLWERCAWKNAIELKASYDHLSGGQQQCVQIARVCLQVLCAPNLCQGLLILDEPTSALDMRYQQSCLHLLQYCAHEKNCVVLCSLHDLQQADAYADHLILLSKGHLIAAGTPEAVLTAAHLQQVYGCFFSVLPHPIQPKQRLILPLDTDGLHDFIA